jgi:hypothetical protein
MEGQREITLAQIASGFTETEPRFTYFHRKLFSYIAMHPTQFTDFMQGLQLRRATFPNSHPANVLVGRLGPLISHQSKSIMTAENGQLRVLFEIFDLKLPDCDYLAIVSPAEKSDNGTNYRLAFESINFAQSLISASLGTLPFYSWVADFDFDASGQVHLSGKAVRLPLHADFAGIINLDYTNRLCERLQHQQPGYRRRLQRACNFYSTAIEQENTAFRFSSYWIALEILVGGRSDAIRSMLSKAYGEHNKRFADEHLLYAEIERVRHDLMHSGVFGGLPSYYERLLQLYFWDIVSYQIGLRSDFALTLARSGVIEQEKEQSPHRQPET